jgi:hypothetical protein
VLLLAGVGAGEKTKVCEDVLERGDGVFVLEILCVLGWEIEYDGCNCWDGLGEIDRGAGM